MEWQKYGGRMYNRWNGRNTECFGSLASMIHVLAARNLTSFNDH